MLPRPYPAVHLEDYLLKDRHRSDTFGWRVQAWNGYACDNAVLKALLRYHQYE